MLLALVASRQVVSREAMLDGCARQHAYRRVLTRHASCARHLPMIANRHVIWRPFPRRLPVDRTAGVACGRTGAAATVVAAAAAPAAWCTAMVVRVRVRVRMQMRVQMRADDANGIRFRQQIQPGTWRCSGRVLWGW